MYKILTLNAISDVIYAQLGEGYAVSAGETQPDAVFVRSASMHDMELPATLLSIARAGAGRRGARVAGRTVGAGAPRASW